MSSHLSKTEYEIMEYFWGMGDKYTFGELMKYFNENLDKNWKKQTLNTFLSRLIEKGLLKKEKSEYKNEEKVPKGEIPVYKLKKIEKAKKDNSL